MMTSRTRCRLLLVGMIGHAPGLRLVFRRSLPPAARRENPAAILITMVALGAAAILGADWRSLVTIWLVGHLAWGARVAWFLWRETT